MTEKPGQQVQTRDYHDVIARVAAVKDLDVAKLEKLMQLQEDWEARSAATHYNEQMALAQQEMTSVSKDSVNPITRSRYASLAALDDAIRPIYTRHGFSIEFNDETPTDRPDWLRLVAYVSCGAETRRREKWLPVSNTGMAGKAAMTAIHASIAAVTYGRRALLKMVFNISEDDDDGNLGKNFPPKPETTETVDDMMAKLEACKTLKALVDYGKVLNSYDLFPVDKEKLVARYNELKTAFGEKKEEATS